MKKISIIDFRGGNLYSVIQACKEVGGTAKITNDYEEILNSDGLILPGVGSFPSAMKILKEKNLIKPIKDFVSSGKPFFGICLGFQLLFSKSEEFENCDGLGLIDGEVLKFKNINNTIKVPHIGWNKIYSDRNWSNTPLKNIKQKEHMYFVHSYFVKPKNVNDSLSMTEYEGSEYCSSILKNNIFATQFHPEKSGKFGLSIYKNWINKL
jgi:imidazole glycerol-phosphate synthase subunit HisH